MKQLYLTIVPMLLLCATAIPVSSLVSNDNEDKVYKVEQRYQVDFVFGQVMVKMNDASPAKDRRIQDKFKNAGVNAMDDLFSEFELEEMEQSFSSLLPSIREGSRDTIYTAQSSTPNTVFLEGFEHDMQKRINETYNTTLAHYFDSLFPPLHPSPSFGWNEV